MPGISLVVSANRDLEDRRAELERLLDAMRHDPSYGTTVLIAEDTHLLAYTAYDEYPISAFEREGNLIVVEGLVYNKSFRQVRDELSRLARMLTVGRDVVGEARDWILGADGDYVVLVLDRPRSQLLFFNDALGRLPLYACQDAGLFQLSREAKFLTGSMKSSVTYDRQAVAEYLLFGYPLGDATLVEGVSRLSGGTLGRVDLARAEAEYFNLHTFNLDECRHRDKPLERLAGELKDVFIETCDDMSTTCGDSKQVVSLSGGLDSRSVAAGMHHVNRRVSGVTFQDDGSDAAIAEQVAAALGIEWRLFDLKPFNLADVNRIVRMKDGLNSVSEILSFLDQLRDIYGRGLVYYTGDGGDQVLPDLSPPYELTTVDGLVDFIVDRRCQFSLAQVEALTSRDRADIRGAIAERVRQYPEQDLSRRYIHFVIFELGSRWLFEGEDRNRCFFWSASPFHSLRVLDYAMNVPDSQKRLHRLYEQFMAALCPKCVGLDTATWGAPFASLRRYLFEHALAAFSRLPHRARMFVGNRTLRRGYEIEPVVREYLVSGQIAWRRVGRIEWRA